LATYLDFEQKIKQIQEDIISAEVRHDKHAAEILQADLEKEVAKTYKNLSPYQELQLARHADRPYALDYINLLMTDKVELHGDRHYADDAAIVCYMGYIGGQRSVVIGEQKGRGTKNKLKRNFGMPNPEGYRKAHSEFVYAGFGSDGIFRPQYEADKNIIIQFHIFANYLVIQSIKIFYHVFIMTVSKICRVIFIKISPEEMFNTIQCNKTHKSQIPIVIF